MGHPVWSHKGNVVAIGAFKDHVKLNFFKGASLNDAHGLFNAGLGGEGDRAPLICTKVTTLMRPP